MKASQLLSSQCRRRLASLQHSNYTILVSPSTSSNLISYDTRPITATRRSYHASLTPSSDNLLGYSPMAQSTPTSKSTSPDAKSSQSTKQGAIWGVDSNTAGGGVWAQTSAKKDKLNELLTELNAEGVVDTGVLGMESLDLAANSEQKLDLELADGLKCIAKCVDSGSQSNGSLGESTIIGDQNNLLIQAMQSTNQNTNEATQKLFQMLNNATKEEEWTRPKFEATMKEAIRVLSAALPSDPTLKKSVAGSLDVTSSLCYIRDFVSDKNNHDTDSLVSDMDTQLQQDIQAINDISNQAFKTSIYTYKTLVLRALATTVLENWEQLTSITSGDIDRAAVNHDGSSPIPSQRDTINSASVVKLFESYESSSCSDFVQAWWNVIDADKDGMIDQEEMNAAVELAMKPVHMALRELLDLSLEVCPTRSAGLGNNSAWFVGGEDFSSLRDDNVSGTGKLSWRNRRTELAARKKLIRTFSTALNRHFRDQVETPHRLRCIYAWADKTHQNNKIDSILVDASEEWGSASSIVGRKRYVELEPKITYEEFREVQKKHFPQLDSMGEEVVMSFKEDLWVLQGKGRQNAELRRDCVLFLGVISLIDLGIGLV